MLLEDTTFSSAKTEPEESLPSKQTPKFVKQFQS